MRNRAQPARSARGVACPQADVAHLVGKLSSSRVGLCQQPVDLLPVVPIVRMRGEPEIFKHGGKSLAEAEQVDTVSEVRQLSDGRT